MIKENIKDTIRLLFFGIFLLLVSVPCLISFALLLQGSPTILVVFFKYIMGFLPYALTNMLTLCIVGIGILGTIIGSLIVLVCVIYIGIMLLERIVRLFQ